MGSSLLALNHLYRIIPTKMSETEVKTDAPTAEEIKGTKRTAEEEVDAAKKQKTENGANGANGKAVEAEENGAEVEEEEDVDEEDEEALGESLDLRDHGLDSRDDGLDRVDQCPQEWARVGGDRSHMSVWSMDFMDSTQQQLGVGFRLSCSQRGKGQNYEHFHVGVVKMEILSGLPPCTLPC